MKSFNRVILCVFLVAITGKAEAASKPSAQFSSTGQSAAIGASHFSAEIVLSAKAKKKVELSFSLSGSAIKGTDYNCSSTSLKIAKGAQSGTLTCALVLPLAARPERSLVLKIKKAGNASLGSAITHTVILSASSGGGTGDGHEVPADSTGGDVGAISFQGQGATGILTTKTGGAITNLSGMAYSPPTQSYFAIRNNESLMHEFKGPGKATRDIKLVGWDATLNEHDLEDIAYLGRNEISGNPEFALVNEIGELYIGEIPPAPASGPDELLKSRFKRVTFHKMKHDNKGPEGVAYDRATQTFWAVKEGDKTGKEIYKFARPLDHDYVADPTGKLTGEIDVSNRLQAVFEADSALDVGDLSSIHFDEGTGRLLILSQVSAVLLDVTQTGVIRNRFKLSGSNSKNLEGVTMGPARNIVLTGEPNAWIAIPGPAN